MTTSLPALLLATLAAIASSGARPLEASPVTGDQQAPRLRILVVHGPNLNLLGRREPEIYGNTTLDQINDRLGALAGELNVELVTLQSNSEGAIVDAFQSHIDDVDGALINGAGLTFSSVSIHDVMKAVPFPVVEVHISNLGARDEIHRNSILTAAARATVMGFGWRSYTAALRALAELVREERAARR
jgi:3-dehydroquinate dehydratase-2